MSEGTERVDPTSRRRLLPGRDSAPDSLRAPIQRSWNRCIDRGLDLIGRPKSEPLTARELSRIIERNERLRAFARPELEALQSEAEATGCIAILTDPKGVILDAVGNSDFADRASRVALMPGVGWGEDVSGTNAIGTALEEGVAVIVQGDEHFFEPHRMLTCSAAPIRSPGGDLLGVLDISGHSGVQHLHALGLVRMAVDQIERRFFFDGSFARHDMIRLHCDPMLVGTPREGILVFEGETLVAANRHGLALLGIDWSALNRTRINQLFSTDPRQIGGDGALRRADGLTLFGNLEAQRSTSMVMPGLGSDTPEMKGDEPVFAAATEVALARSIRLSAAGIPILLQGEGGTGKEVFARAVHEGGGRKVEDFMTVNCAVSGESELRALLFGPARGMPAPGTLYIDQIELMPRPVQRQLLISLQSREHGAEAGAGAATGLMPADIDLICGTRQDLADAVRQGTFDGDLYFRIAPYAVALPALRELADLRHVILRLFASAGAARRKVTLADETLERLASYGWPGNFRQLSGILKALVALAEPGERLKPDALPAYVAAEGSVRSETAADLSRGLAGETPLDELELSAMQAAVDAAGGNISLAAKRLGIHRATLYRRLLSRQNRKAE